MKSRLFKHARILLCAILLAAPLRASDENKPMLLESSVCILADLGPLLEGASKDRSLTPELQQAMNRLASEILKLWKVAFPKEGPLNLEAAQCRGATTCLAHILREGFRALNIQRMQSLEGVRYSHNPHIYLRIPDHLGPGQDLIIDPTIRQFFTNQKLTRAEVDQIPQIFVGSRAELEALFARWLKPRGSAYESWLERYFQAEEDHRVDQRYFQEVGADPFEFLRGLLHSVEFSPE